MGNTDPKHGLVHWLKAGLTNPNGKTWNTGYVTSSANLLADMRFNVTRELQALFKAICLYHS